MPRTDPLQQEEEMSASSPREPSREPDTQPNLKVRAPKKIAILGLPNSGKSQVFNNLTGDYAVVANYPLTTVEILRKTCTIRDREYEIIDTPGLHCLYIHSEEELLIRDFLFSERPDGIIQCIDANRLKQSLLLTLDLLELDIPLVISLNAIDETEHRGITLNIKKLSQLLGVKVVEQVAIMDGGSEGLKDALADLQVGSYQPYYGKSLEAVLSEVQSLLPDALPFQRKYVQLLVAGDRHLFRELGNCYGKGFQERIRGKIHQLGRASRSNFGRALNDRRDAVINVIAQQIATKPKRESGKIARTFAQLCRHPLFGLPILAGFLYLTYFLIVNVAGAVEGFLSARLVDPVVALIDRLVSLGFLKEFLIGDYGILTLGLFNAFVTVLPILSVFFLVMGLLEDIGYLPNLTVLTHRILSKIGLTGKSVMSLVLGFGCKTMATLTTKGITSRKEKFIAIYLIAFAIPCSAQLAIDMAILGRVGFKAFLIAYGTLALVELGAGFVLNKIKKEDQAGDFIQELPPIRPPRPRAIFKKTYYRLYWFLKEAVPIFIIAAITLFLADKSGLLLLLKQAVRPVVVGWLGLPLNIVEVLILSLARHEAAAGLLLSMVDRGELGYIQTIVSVVITTMFIPCFANIVAICKEMGLKVGLLITLIINTSSFILAGMLRWVLVFLRVGAP